MTYTCVVQALTGDESRMLCGAAIQSGRCGARQCQQPPGRALHCHSCSLLLADPVGRHPLLGQQLGSVPVYILCREGVVRGGVVGQGLRGLVGGATAGLTGGGAGPCAGLYTALVAVAVDQKLFTTPLSMQHPFLSVRGTRVQLSRHMIADVDSRDNEIFGFAWAVSLLVLTVLEHSTGSVASRAAPCAAGTADTGDK